MTPDEDMMSRWEVVGARRSTAIPALLYDMLGEIVTPDMRTLEFGTGLSTLLFDEIRSGHRAVEHDPAWYGRIKPLVGTRCRIDICRITTESEFHWYDWEHTGAPFDLVLIDGPPGRIGREGVLNVISSVAGADTVVILDDVHRPAEQSLFEQLADALQRRGPEVYQCPNGQSPNPRAFGVL